MRKCRWSSAISAGLLIAVALSSTASATKVVFNGDGVAVVDGRPFFPIGIYCYNLTSDIMADLHERRFNTIVNIVTGFEASQLDFIHQNGLMSVVPYTPEWVKAAKDHPSLLAYYLTDEPEGHGDVVEKEREKYLEMRREDPNHPGGLCHYLFGAIERFKDACDFTMSDVYPVTASRDTPLRNVGVHIDEAHRVHGRMWPTWAWIQVFGGPDTDGGKWAQPLAQEVRCMTYIALAHGATGILYFSYWPKAPETWGSLGELNREIEVITPYLVAPGKESAVSSDKNQIEMRARKCVSGGVVIAVNTQPTYVSAKLKVDGLRNSLEAPFENRALETENGSWQDRFAPHEAHVYVWGKAPKVELGGMR
ncbi:MAG: hypothetical protein IT209_07425 [Armatimonadetes bacterium]|nr:hypothetical protein [Armatimonadota bacterium]